MPFRPPPASTWELYQNLKVHPTWGYVIYRTTYSPPSDAHFSTIVKYLDACLKAEFFRECAREVEYQPSVDPAIYNVIWSKHSSTIMEDKAHFDGASTDSIRAHFEAWVDAQGQRDRFNKFRMCIVIDEECLQTLIGTSAEAIEQETEYETEETVRYVKVVEAWPIVDQYDEFPGWMKCWSRVLWDLWKMMCDGDELRMSYEKIDDFCDGVYSG
ncbi:uncharacterized protein N7482_007355 [Penicillium canariense]|uniref:Uncharacterized protein n=1 Tax=Penicillium canariense TaxID=189055 RepID=A0A9W9LKI0_9EURO|nr:uncharacterized protein N7482_007355 [Penicillium canariense]KAJ5160351.1 hypothetical protein N7482_007355 [Penicillium canariense]